MNALTAALQELAQFTFVEWFGFAPKNKPETLKPLYLTTPVRELLTGSTVSSETVDTPAPMAIQYVVSEKSYVYEQPTQTFDGAVSVLTAGQQVEVLVSSGRWAQIQTPQILGWTLRDELGQAKNFEEFNFLVGEYYGPEHSVTEQVRSYISDTFAATPLAMPLQAVEYVYARLLQSGRAIVWPEVRPRLAGRWQTILAGQPHIHISIAPTVGSVMEWTDEEDIGHLAYVENTFADQSLIISEIGLYEAGRYSERTLPYREWRELRPIFIEVL
ncbi:hypothetical protein KC722_01535 [Candidatus Kaiserbacteria bacterium]|nr:hypothetical protein [Candidatus Kaiserbacteria bacterium]MCB9812001.1 hypothetical protein [Candidatus Nomurabacteria bacterium]